MVAEERRHRRGAEHRVGRGGRALEIAQRPRVAGERLADGEVDRKIELRVERRRPDEAVDEVAIAVEGLADEVEERLGVLELVVQLARAGDASRPAGSA